MKRRITFNPNTILSPGTRVVTRVAIDESRSGGVHPLGAVGVIVKSPTNHEHAYRIRFTDGNQVSLLRAEFAPLREIQGEPFEAVDGSRPSKVEVLPVMEEYDLSDRILYRCIVGSRAFGLDEDSSDTDVRGIYLAPAHMQWSLYGVPEQLDSPQTEECYWELQKFIALALKANPNILECLYTPLIEHADPIAHELLDMRESFLSKLIYQTYNGYVLSQFKKLSNRLGAKGEVKWKHAMHLIRLLLSGIEVLREGEVLVGVGEHRKALLSIRRGEMSWAEVNAWRVELHKVFDDAYAHSQLPDRPDYQRADKLLIEARKHAAAEQMGSSILYFGSAPIACDPAADGDQAQVGEWDDSNDEMRCSECREISDGGIAPAHWGVLQKIVSNQPYPLLFATISGAHLYGFPSPDSDFDLRGVHCLPCDEVLGLKRRRETVEHMGDENEQVELDLVTHDIEKFMRMMLRRNGYVLEQLCSPLVLYTTDAHAELLALVPKCVTRRHAHHYLGFARRQWELFESSRRLKPLLYTYRVLLTGIHLMRTGEVEANIVRLNETMGLAYVDELVELKTRGAERMLLPAARFTFHEEEYQRLTGLLEAEMERSTLPDEPTGLVRLNDLLVRLRFHQ